jgi:hypothetical protein
MSAHFHTTQGGAYIDAGQHRVTLMSDADVCDMDAEESLLLGSSWPGQTLAERERRKALRDALRRDHEATRVSTLQWLLWAVVLVGAIVASILFPEHWGAGWSL